MIPNGQEIIFDGHNLTFESDPSVCRGCFFEDRDSCPDCDEGIWVEEGSPWHTGTPTENGYYLCKVFYDKETENDMRILEWVNELGCFCIPDSKIRAYHYYIGENNGEHVEVVYEWQKLDMRFRMETKLIEPFKEKS